MAWPGNVRQLENTARWLTVMASGKEIHPDDLPPEIAAAEATAGSVPGQWQTALKSTINQRLQAGETSILDDMLPEFETIVIETALLFTGGRKQDAAKLLGWGRNTLTRKIKELGLDRESE